MTRLAGADALSTLDPVFARLAIGAGHNLWGLRHLTVREKTFICLTADLCHPHLDEPLAMHLQMAVVNGVDSESVRELFRHLAPYVGYPIVLTAFRRLAELGLPRAEGDDTIEPTTLGAPLAGVVEGLAVAPGLASFTGEQLAQLWDRPYLSVRERAIACLVVDILYQTLAESLRLHADLARSAGLTDEALQDLLAGVAEFGMPRAWSAAAALFAG